MDTANKDAEVVVHLSIKGKGSSQSEHLHLCVYVQEDPSASCPWPDAQVHLLSPTRKLVAARALLPLPRTNADGSAQSFRIRPPQYVINYRYFTVLYEPMSYIYGPVWHNCCEPFYLPNTYFQNSFIHEVVFLLILQRHELG